MKTSYLAQVHHILGALLLLQGTSHAAVSLFAEYHLGETLSVSGGNNAPQDTSGNGHHFAGVVAAATVVNAPSPASTAYFDTSGASNQGYWGDTAFSALNNDNFAFSVWGRAASTAAANQGCLFSVGNTGYAIALGANGWTAGIWNTATNTVDAINFLGTVGGSGFVADTWTNLTVIRQNGVSTFYMNGVAQSGTLTASGTNGTGYISMNPNNAGNVYDGLLDEVKVVTFSGSDSTANILSSLNAVPEPSAALLGGLSALMLVRRRR